ncbi:MAG: AI-2E family transporter [Gammaproteobacteria bacterium]|nr:AI-2E family transporter [Gammaproteobacteria bacterium]MBU1646716.1 AI-2E family transporter [Gammaproteobacteria bacterium]MBU1971749.1 AI-2E family transporter [Gammaproteobacteria bacterium]
MVWAGIIGATCLLLFVFQKMLWLVVPFLLALVLYYMLFPPVQRLVYGGMSREAATGVVMVGFLAVLGVGFTLMLPWLAAHLVDGQASIERYVQGGLKLAERSLQALEARWALLAEAEVAESMVQRLDYMSGHLSRHIEPLAMGIAAWTPSLLLAPFVTFFLLRDGQRFKRFLGSAVPNAFFERTLYLLHEVDRTARAYFQGLIQLTVLDTITLAVGLWAMGFPGALALGFICAVLAWVPYVGSILGGLLVVLVAATDFPETPAMAYWAVTLFVFARLLDDFFYMPLTIGKSLHMHPVVTVVMIFVGGAVAGVPGLMLVLPVLGVVMVVGATIGEVVTDPRLMARHYHARALRKQGAGVDLGL